MVVVSKDTVSISGLIVSWYLSNIGVLLLNKFLLSNYGFAFPIFLTMCHMSACAAFSYISIVLFKIVQLQPIRSRSQLLKISALSVVFCSSVVGGNVSLKYLPVSFNQAVGATTPFFTALFAYLMTFKREAWVTYGALVPVVAGVVIASGGEPSFHLFGFIMCIGATAARAFKSVLQGILLSSEGEKLNSMNLLLYMSPIAVLFLLPVTLVMEPTVLSAVLSLGSGNNLIWILLLVNSAMAYFVNLSNFLVTKHTSPLTLQQYYIVSITFLFMCCAFVHTHFKHPLRALVDVMVVLTANVLSGIGLSHRNSLFIKTKVLGNAKGAVAVVISIFLFRNPISFMGMAGYSLTVIGVVIYGETKRRYK